MLFDQILNKMRMDLLELLKNKPHKMIFEIIEVKNYA